MRTVKDIEFAPCAAGRVGRDALWPVATTSAHRPPVSGSNPSASPELADLAWVTVQVRTALEEMTLAAQAAVAGARAIVEVMDAAVAVLDVAERASVNEAAAHGPTRQGGGLSPREREVLALVTEGRSNKAIAEALFLSPNTIKTHVASLMNKLDAESRAQLAAIAARHEGPLKVAPHLQNLETLAS
jgi:DNA-binding CsgD family transcriptional regulator